MIDRLAPDSEDYSWQVKRFGKQYVDAYAAGVMAYRAGLGINCPLSDKSYAMAYCDGWSDARDKLEW